MRKIRIGYRIRCPICNNVFLDTTDESDELVVTRCPKCKTTIDILTNICGEYVSPIYKQEA